MRRPNRLATSSTSTRALRPRSSRKGLSSTRSSEPTRPESCSISMIRCASRKVAPPGTAVPTAGAMPGSRKSMSKLTWRCPEASATRSRLRRSGATTPNSSMWRMSVTSTSRSATSARSPSSIERRPNRCTRVGSRMGRSGSANRPARPGSPQSAASGMPWRLPEGEVSGVLKSACASSQSTKSGRALRAQWRIAPSTVPSDRLWSPPTTRGRSPASSAASTRRARARLQAATAGTPTAPAGPSGARSP